MAVDIHDFDEDHWFLLFTLDEGVHGHPPYDLLRCKESSLARMNPKYRFGRKMDQISTRLKDGKRLENYDDWDCLDDFINQGLIELFDRDDPRLRLILTGLGSEIKEELSNYILDGGDYSGFYPSILVSQEIRSSLDSIEGPA